MPFSLPELSDDAPTIISKTPPRPIRAEDAFPATLKGRKLAHFELIESIGVGGMAAVIRARDTQLDRIVALKILPPEMAADPENVRRFHQEARAAAKLDHENIARVFFCGDDQGLHFIAFEFVEGENLRTILDRRRRLPVTEAVHYLLQIATGLAHSSSRGVVHRDIKPSNIIISPNGRAKLVDMGLARSMEPHNDIGLTQSGVTLGTFDYISPEQALEPRDADVRSDIYSLGCTFYHMLTGEPPVPEGTAAKKLHHHQHVAPIDPRQFDPEIPDEVAAILAHMMAKDVKFRYQRAEHLVHHLIQLAQKLGGPPEMPDGVLFVDTPLPAAPGIRPVLVAAAALVILVTVVVLHSMFPGSNSASAPSNANSNPVKHADAQPGSSNQNASDTSEPKNPVPILSQPTGRNQRDILTAKELVAFLAKPRNNFVPVEAFLISDDYDLNQEFGEGHNRRMPGLIFQGGEDRHLVIQPKDPARRATIRLKYNPELREENGEEVPAWTALTIHQGAVTLRNLRFEIDGARAQIRMAAVKLLEGGRLTLENCEFVQLNPPETGPAWMNSVVVVNGQADIRSCYFQGAEKFGKPADNSWQTQEAIVLEGGTSVTVANCCFGPHAALFHLRKGNGSTSALNIGKCSSLLDEGSVFLIDEEASGKLTVKSSVFSPSGPGVSGSKAILIHQKNQGSAIQYAGADNRYYNLAGFWTLTASGETKFVAGRWNEFLAVLTMQEGTEENSQELTISPWEEKDPLNLLKAGHPESAFTANVELSQMRQTKPASGMVGMQVGPWGPLYNGLPPLEEKKPAALAQKIVDPTQKTGNGNYQNLKSAFGETKAGDEILLKTNENLRIQPVELVQANDNVTLKPYPGYHPVLMLETDDLDGAFFLLKDGKLTLEGLEFVLRANRQGFTSLSVVAVIGDGKCVIKNCVATLEEPKGVPLALVMLTNPLKVMKMESTNPRNLTPSLWVDQCFIRGQGDLVAIHAARPLELKVENSLVALTGSFLTVEGSTKDSSRTDPVQVSLSHVTAFLADSMIGLRAGKDGKEPIPIQVNPASNCVFASAAEGKPLVHLEGMETAFQMKHQFCWENGKQNVYSRFQPLLDQKPKGDEMPVQPYDQQAWKKFTNEMDGVFTPVTFTSPPDADSSQATGWSKSLPGHFRIKGESTYAEQGANIELLPKPAASHLEELTPGK